jgi:hypothetical protein
MVAVLMTSFVLAWLQTGHAADPADDSVYYTRVGFFHEKGTHKTTNYLRGFWVPINTEVEVLGKRSSHIDIRIVETGQRIRISNKDGHSGENIDGIFKRMLSRDATDLAEFSSEQRRRIMAGGFEPGMTKEEVILAIGYPPKHRTPSLESNEWRYWQSRFDTVILYFKDGVLDHVQD